MHFEILVEDQSGKMALDILIPKIIGDKHSFRVLPYKGIGRIPINLNPKTDANKRILLDQLPRVLSGFGSAHKVYPTSERPIVLVVCDLDDKCLKQFRRELLDILKCCKPEPLAHFCIAVEEGEAWLLGDIKAVKSAYSRAKNHVLEAYRADSINGTWERLADAVYPGGSLKLIRKGWHAIGSEKSDWARNIAAKMDIDRNTSPSFCYFRDILRELSTQGDID
jgi:hypothetical protein